MTEELSARLKILIDRYLAATSDVVSQLRLELGSDDLLGAVGGRRIPRSGVLRNGAEFEFHGVGCHVDVAGIVVDLDFGPGGRSDGFDAWRLSQFARQFPEHAEFSEQAAVEAGLRALEQTGAVIRPRLPPSPHLYYLASKSNKEAR